MSIAFFATIWAALVLFVAGEAGKRRLEREHAASASAWRLWTLGAALCVVHVLLAFALRHGWSHAAAVDDTARRTAEVFGRPWGGGVYVNYLFVSAWLIEACWWRASPAGFARRPRWIAWTFRAFYALVLVNAAVVFARPTARLAGIALCAALAWTWRPARGWRRTLESS